MFEEMRPAYRACLSDSGIYDALTCCRNGINHRIGSGVTLRRLACLRQAVGTTRNPILFTNIRSRLRTALFNHIKRNMKNLQDQVLNILVQISSDIEMLRGSEARILASNGDFLERLGEVVRIVMPEMERIGALAERVKRDAESQSDV